ncbi:MAG: hypothetical protein JW782_04855 [Candidatus Saganbacteria bacterium]|nr:hypothetical protein [Candidatus Saganbacteria bacterium]
MAIKKAAKGKITNKKDIRKAAMKVQADLMSLKKQVNKAIKVGGSW